MSKNHKKTINLRGLVTDTLPYEVPVIFSNDKYHAGLAAHLPEPLNAFFARLNANRSAYTIPYNYRIAKDERKSTLLSIIHPHAQQDFVSFYNMHSGSILNFCSNSRFSLRRPIALASPFVDGKLVSDDGMKSGAALLLEAEGAPDISHLSSYFVYGKYNLLGRFIGSREYTRLETRFRLCRMLDVTKCFYNIYTHSISWATKDKAFAKEHKNAYSFESEFDKLMQRCNYNETNGIVVGPEFSRIFAEIILQAIDHRLFLDLVKLGLSAGVDYDIRRYVDDYFVFANSNENLDKIETCLKERLEEGKLHVNEKKILTSSRPFVSQLSLAREEIGALLRQTWADVRAMKTINQSQMVIASRKFSYFAQSVRLIVAKYAVSFTNLSGWLMSRLRILAKGIIRDTKRETVDIRKTIMIDFTIIILEASLYIASMDIRVRSTYSLCQLALTLRDAKALFSGEQTDLAEHLLMDEVSNMLRVTDARNEKNENFISVEALNLLICGAEFIGVEFLRSSSIIKFLRAIASIDTIGYFSFISAKFCFLKDIETFEGDLKLLNEKIEGQIRANLKRINLCTETFLMVCDFLSSTEVDVNVRRNLYNDLFGGQISNQNVDELASYVGFSDWTGIKVRHLLKRKELRPVYAWG